MIVRVEADTRNSREALRRLDALRRSAEPGAAAGVGTTTLFTRIGIRVLRWVDQNFAGGGGPVGGWAPLRPLTVFARRMGSSFPLSNTGALRRSFVFKADATSAAVGTYGALAQIARWQSVGTRPYDIYPRNKKALAFPAPPSFVGSAGVGFFARARIVGQKGSPMPKAEPRTGLTTKAAIRAAGLRGPQGRAPGGIKSFAVVKHVHHPGLPARRILPTAEELGPMVQEVVQDYLAEATR